MKAYEVRRAFQQLWTTRLFSLPPEYKRSKRIASALTFLQEQADLKGKLGVEDKPVFLMSACWRAGSTLTQRLILSSGEIAMWGEPLGKAALIPKLADSLAAVDETMPMYHGEEIPSDAHALSSKWVANLAPPFETIAESHRALLEAWLAEPARNVFGLERWGLKEVRLSIDHARYLRFLYPQAKFVFIVRDVRRSYLSWRANGWGEDWPDLYTYWPVSYGLLWKNLAQGYWDGHKDVGGFFLRFEDLVAGKTDLTALAEYLEVEKLDAGVLEKKVGGNIGEAAKAKKTLTAPEKYLLSAVAGSTMKTLGYT
jgi:hypothetical protein